MIGPSGQGEIEGASGLTFGLEKLVSLGSGESGEEFLHRLDHRSQGEDTGIPSRATHVNQC
jgi:hypothetical protein